METQKTITALGVLLALGVLASVIAYGSLEEPASMIRGASQEDSASAEVAGIAWGDLGMRMVDGGVIDLEKFSALYASRGGISDEAIGLLTEVSPDTLVVDTHNAGLVLNLLWAFGLGNKNPILEEGPMTDPRYAGADRFASTGGWTLAEGNTMNHYNAHSFVTLTPEQQHTVEGVSKNIYRPCCNNPAYFPDCNHGMAMLGALELMAARGTGEEEMYRAALVLNSLWFSTQYATIERYRLSQSPSLQDLEPKELLGAAFSSARGYAAVRAAVPMSPAEGGVGCAA